MIKIRESDLLSCWGQFYPRILIGEDKNIIAASQDTS